MIHYFVWNQSKSRENCRICGPQISKHLNATRSVLSIGSARSNRNIWIGASIHRREHGDITNKYDTSKERQQIQAFEAPCERKGVCASEDAEARRNAETHSEREAETLSAFFSSFELFGVKRFLWCSSFSRRLLLVVHRCVDAEALSPRLQLPFVLLCDVSECQELDLTYTYIRRLLLLLGLLVRRIRSLRFHQWDSEPSGASFVLLQLRVLRSGAVCGCPHGSC